MSDEQAMADDEALAGSLLAAVLQWQTEASDMDALLVLSGAAVARAMRVPPARALRALALLERRGELDLWMLPGRPGEPPRARYVLPRFALPTKGERSNG